MSKTQADYDAMDPLDRLLVDAYCLETLNLALSYPERIDTNQLAYLTDHKTRLLQLLEENRLLTEADLNPQTIAIAFEEIKKRADYLNFSYEVPDYASAMGSWTDAVGGKRTNSLEEIKTKSVGSSSFSKN